MSAATRIGDVCTGHGCFGPRRAIGGSTNVFINGIGANRATDLWETHCCGPSCHDGRVIQASSKVFINGLPAVRIGDLLDCGSAVAQGSPNTFFG
jgi:uncharacterized Zn-binding protein involved in type VI secretion